MPTDTASKRPVSPTHAEHDQPTHALLSLAEAEELSATLKRIAVRSERALSQGDAREGIAQVERWVESYRRGLAAAQKISHSGIDMLRKTRDQLALSLEERLRLEDEGGNPPSQEQVSENEDMAHALSRIDRILPVLEHTFQDEAQQAVA